MSDVCFTFSRDSSESFIVASWLFRSSTCACSRFESPPPPAAGLDDAGVLGAAGTRAAGARAGAFFAAELIAGFAAADLAAGATPAFALALTGSYGSP